MAKRSDVHGTYEIAEDPESDIYSCPECGAEFRLLAPSLGAAPEVTALPREQVADESEGEDLSTDFGTADDYDADEMGIDPEDEEI